MALVALSLSSISSIAYSFEHENFFVCEVEAGVKPEIEAEEAKVVVDTKVEVVEMEEAKAIAMPYPANAEVNIEAKRRT